MPRRASKWILHDEGKSWSVSRGGRTLYQGLQSRQEAIGRLRNHHRPGEPVVMEEPDGYQTNITAQLRKSGLIS